MSKDIFSWSADDYETDRDRKEAFEKFMKNFQNFVYEEKLLTLDEYKEQVSCFWKKVKNKLFVS